MAIPIWMGLAPEWYTWYNQNENAQIFKWLYTTLNERWLVNIPISGCIICLSIHGYIRMWRDKSCRCIMLPLSILGLVILHWDSQVAYANIIHSFNYRTLFSTLLIITAIITFFKFTKGIVSTTRTPKNEDTNTTGFSTDNINNEDIPLNLKNYAYTITTKLLATNILKQSYALGITGEWGCGKTTFLNLLKEQLKGKADIVEFNPWMCRTPEQVTHDFFASLRHQLSPKYSSLSSPIKKYAKYINSLSLTPHNILGTEISFSSNKKSLFENKKELSAIFSSLPQPVAVIIDDIDRLEREEVFEVLRLIRNTADLCNTIYFVAYDKEYVTSILEEKNIREASSYLEKIFHAEIHLPKVSSHMIWNCLQADIKKQSKKNSHIALTLFQHFGDEDRTLILQTLDNYRRAKRFARIFMLNIDYFGNHFNKEIHILDLFWLELLQVYDKPAYDKLSNDTSSLLYSNSERLTLRPGIAHKARETENIRYNGEEFWKRETPKILQKLFSPNTRARKESICYTENYEKYFALNILPHQLSIKETNELFIPGCNHQETIHKWITDGKQPNSIIYQLKQIAIAKLPEDKTQVLIESILNLALAISRHPHYTKELKKTLRKEHFDNSSKTELAHDTALSWLNSRISESFNPLQMSTLLNRLYVTRGFDPEGNEEPVKPLIISNQEIEELLIKIIDKYLTNNPQHTALDIIKENNQLHTLFNNCSVTTADLSAFDNNNEYKQTAFDTIIEHFANKSEKPTLKEFDQAHKAFTYQKPPGFSNSDEEEYWWSCYYENIEYKMEKHFGSSYSNKLKEFESKCFIPTPESDSPKQYSTKPGP